MEKTYTDIKATIEAIQQELGAGLNTALRIGQVLLDVLDYAKDVKAESTGVLNVLVTDKPANYDLTAYSMINVLTPKGALYGVILPGKSGGLQGSLIKRNYWYTVPIVMDITDQWTFQSILNATTSNGKRIDELAKAIAGAPIEK